MPSKLKVVFYFGFAGILPLLFFSIQDISQGVVEVFDWAYFQAKVLNFLTSYCITVFVSAAVLYLPIRLLEKRLPWQGNVGKRAIIEFLTTCATAVVARNMTVNILILVGISKTEIFSESYWRGELVNSIMALFMNLVLVSIYEGTILFSWWKQSLVENEKLEKENLASKFEALKNQVNPHFLFNSLNTLSNLVHEDADKAEDFIDEFSHIYRYALEKKDKMVVPVQEEIDFVKSYLKLCQIRFEEGLRSDIHLDVDKLDTFIPTLALQTLVENAIKHNKITKKEPLTISIYTEEAVLVVENNYQPRDDEASSTGIGIQNIRQRYEMLSTDQPSFKLSNDLYIAKLPLIKSS